MFEMYIFEVKLGSLASFQGSFPGSWLFALSFQIWSLSE